MEHHLQLLCHCSWVCHSSLHSHSIKWFHANNSEALVGDGLLCSSSIFWQVFLFIVVVCKSVRTIPLYILQSTKKVLFKSEVPCWAIMYTVNQPDHNSRNTQASYFEINKCNILRTSCQTSEEYITATCKTLGACLAMKFDPVNHDIFGSVRDKKTVCLSELELNSNSNESGHR